jgi:hypothetical protein
VNRGQQLLPMLRQKWPVHEQVAKAREDYP